jgi:hypothetical protein
MLSTGNVLLGRGAIVAAMLCSGAAQAQTQTQSTTAAEQGSVTQQTDSGLAPTGVTLGSYRFFPTLSSTVSYDTNIYNRRTPEVSDGYARFAPSVDLRSLWARHSLALQVDGDVRRYFKNTSENSAQYGADVAGRYDIASNALLFVTGDIARRIEPRGTSGDVLLLGAGPNTYYQKSVGLTLRTTPGRLLFELRGNAGRYDYVDNRSGNTVVDLSFRDFVSTSLGARAGYAVGPGTYIFVDGAKNWARYPNSTTTDRNSDGFSLNGGLRINLNPLVGGELAVGYIKQNFSSPLFSDVSGLGYSGSIFWNPTALLSLRFNANRSIQRAPVIASAGIDQSRFELSVDYAPLRRLLFTASGQYVRSAFRGLGVSDDQFVETFTGRYNVNRYIDLTGAVNFRQRSANVSTRDYTGSSFRAGIIAKY